MLPSMRGFRYRLIVQLVALGLAGGSLVSCGESQPGTMEPSSASTSNSDTSLPEVIGRRPAEDTSGGGTPRLLALLPEDGILYAAPLVVFGEVTAEAGPFWNTTDGQKWTEVNAPLAEGGDFTSPRMYREITFKVVETIRDDLGLSDDPLVFVAQGGGEAAVDDPDRYYGGRFEVGGRYVLFLAPGVLAMREAPVAVLMPFYNYQGVYAVHEGHVTYSEGSDAKRSAAVDEFLSDVTSRRATLDAEWEPYRVEEGDIKARIDAAMKAIQTGIVERTEGS